MFYPFPSLLEALLEFPFLYGQRFLVHHAKDACEVAVMPCPFPGLRKNVLDLLENDHHEVDDPGGDLTMMGGKSRETNVGTVQQRISSWNPFLAISFVNITMK